MEARSLKKPGEGLAGNNGDHKKESDTPKRSRKKQSGRTQIVPLNWGGRRFRKGLGSTGGECTRTMSQKQGRKKKKKKGKEQLWGTRGVTTNIETFRKRRGQI